MTSLVIYVIVFAIVAVMIGMISTFFYENVYKLSFNAGQAEEYNKFNLYILKYVKNGYSILDIKNDENECYLKLSNGSEEVKFELINHELYFNKIKLCKNIDSFTCSSGVSENGKNILETMIKIDGKEYKTSYVLSESSNNIENTEDL